MHDLAYGEDDISTLASDQQLINCLGSTDSALGTAISGIIKVKQTFDSLTSYASDSMLRVGDKRKAEEKQERAVRVAYKTKSC